MAGQHKQFTLAGLAETFGLALRGDGSVVLQGVGTLAGWQKDAIIRLRDLVVAAAPDSTSEIKWGQPVFEKSGPFAWMRSFPMHVTLGFWRGAELNDSRLEGTGGKMRHVKFHSVGEIDDELVGSLVRQAVALNETQGDPTQRA